MRLDFLAVERQRHAWQGFLLLGGLTEASETLTVFAAMCLWSAHFSVLACGFAILCAISTGMRVVWGYRRLR